MEIDREGVGRFQKRVTPDLRGMSADRIKRHRQECLCHTSMNGMLQMMKSKRVWVVALGLALLAAATLAGQQTAGSSSESDGVLAFLERSISWYRQATAQQQLVTEPNDALVFGENRRVAEQAIRLAFEFARGRAKTLAKSGAAGQE